jgi:hypothetical protein
MEIPAQSENQTSMEFIFILDFNTLGISKLIQFKVEISKDFLVEGEICKIQAKECIEDPEV